jgi:hypothetical protein
MREGGAHGRRLALLLACLALGVLVGAAGSAITGSGMWWLAVPALIAAGWLAVANPEACTPPPPRRPGGEPPAA